MRFYLDASIPAQALAHLRLPDSAERWEGRDDRNGDEELVARAVEAGAGVLVVVGREMLDQPRLAESAAAAGLTLVAIDIDDPIDVIDRVGSALRDVANQAAAGQVFVVTKYQVHQIGGG